MTLTASRMGLVRHGPSLSFFWAFREHMKSLHTFKLLILLVALTRILTIFISHRTRFKEGDTHKEAGQDDVDQEEGEGRAEQKPDNPAGEVPGPEEAVDEWLKRGHGFTLPSSSMSSQN